MNGTISLAVAFIAGVSGSLHCLAMCGGLAGALGMRARRRGGSAPAALMHVSAYQFGRLLSYGLAGAICGWFGSFARQLLDLAGLSLWLRVLAGILIMAMGLQILLRRSLLGVLERVGARFWSRIAPLARTVQGNTVGQDLGNAVLLGMLWGWLPCGLVYSMLVLGALGADPAQGAWVMLAFGLGTLPAMLGSSLLAAQWARFAASEGVRALAGVSLLGFGVWTSVVALRHMAH